MDLGKYRRLNEAIVMLNRATIQNNTLNAAYNDSSIIVTSRYYEYIAFLFTSILLILLFLRFNTSGMQSGGGSGWNYNIIIIKVALVIIFIIFYINRKKINNYM